MVSEKDWRMGIDADFREAGATVSQRGMEGLVGTSLLRQ
jgi:hypothetical protein